jgi:putative ATP-dependent endonuclease of the OLD family
LKAIAKYGQFCERCEEFGIFSNSQTLELDLFEGGYADAIIRTLREAKFGKERTELIDGWEEDNDALEPAQFLSMVESIGKGRFAQRLASKMSDLEVPTYISAAIKFVAAHV